MSFPSVKNICEEQGINPETATSEVLQSVLVDAIKRDLPDGYKYIHDMAHQSVASSERVLNILDPNSHLGKQVARLMGADMPRVTLQDYLSKHLGTNIHFGFYNCCSPVVAPTKEMLNMSVLEQINLQNGVLGNADC